MAFDQTNRATDAGTYRVDIPASAGANTTVGNSTIGSPKLLMHIWQLGAAANVTIGNGANITIYDGNVPSVANTIWAVVGNTTLIGNIPLFATQTIKLPIMRGCCTIAGEANCARTMFSFLMEGSDGQPLNSPAAPG